MLSFTTLSTLSHPRASRTVVSRWPPDILGGNDFEVAGFGFRQAQRTPEEWLKEYQSNHHVDKNRMEVSIMEELAENGTYWQAPYPFQPSGVHKFFDMLKLPYEPLPAGSEEPLSPADLLRRCLRSPQILGNASNAAGLMRGVSALRDTLGDGGLVWSLKKSVVAPADGALPYSLKYYVSWKQQWPKHNLETVLPLIEPEAKEGDGGSNEDEPPVEKRCLPSCDNPCVELNGNFALECGGCGASAGCGPFAAGFPSERATVTDEVTAEVTAGGASLPLKGDAAGRAPEATQPADWYEQEDGKWEARRPKPAFDPEVYHGIHLPDTMPDKRTFRRVDAFPYNTLGIDVLDGRHRRADGIHFFFSSLTPGSVQVSIRSFRLRHAVTLNDEDLDQEMDLEGIPPLPPWPFIQEEAHHLCFYELTVDAGARFSFDAKGGMRRSQPPPALTHTPTPL